MTQVIQDNENYWIRVDTYTRKNDQKFTKHAILITVNKITKKKYIDFVPKTDMSDLRNTKLPKYTL